MLASAPVWAAVLPQQAGPLEKVGSKPGGVAEPAIFTEYGLQETERAEYAGAGQRLALTGHRFKDSTGAFGAQLALQASGGSVEQIGNYVLVFPGGKPGADTLQALAGSLQKVDRTDLPPLPNYFPENGRVAASDRYILGPESLRKYAPKVPANVAGFDMGAEGQAAQYRTPHGPVELAIFSYPTPQIARLKLAEFGKLPGAVAGRKGPLVAVLFSPPDADDAERLLASVRYDAQITWNEPPPNPRNDVGDLLLNIVYLTLILFALFLAAGIVVGVLRRSFRWRSAEEEMIVLRIEE